MSESKGEGRRLLTLPMALAALASRQPTTINIRPMRPPSFGDMLMPLPDFGYPASRPWRGATRKRRRNPNKHKQAAAKRARKITRRHRP